MSSRAHITQVTIHPDLRVITQDDKSGIVPAWQPKGRHVGIIYFEWIGDEVPEEINAFIQRVEGRKP